MKKRILSALILLAVLFMVLYIALSGKKDKEANSELTKVMERITEEYLGTDQVQKYEDVSVVEMDPEYGDRLLLMAESKVEEKEVQIYGIISQEYGQNGIVIDVRENGKSHLNYFEWSWNPHHYEPWIQVGDYDLDGKDEFAFYADGGTGTGFHWERLMIFEMSDTGIVKPYELDRDTYEEEVTKLVEEQVNEDTLTVDILERGTENVLISGMSYDIGDHPQYKGMSYADYMHIMPDGRTGAALYIVATPGVMTVDIATPQYTAGEMENLVFEVEYHASENGEESYFTLANPGVISE